MAQNTFSKLVNNLSATEKSTLLSKLLKYTDESVNEEVQNVSKIKTDKSKTKEFAQKEFEKFSLVKKIYIYLLSFFKNSTIEDEVVESELVDVKKELLSKCNRYFEKIWI